ncbi:hypothetical protein BV25DRAFT_1919999 [Artomyces pyxidatus]|uniref:Uncharacterized protein n=1 Tax=Artomyces pyxidatus TaxID=48021 RepID=A0ACB8SME9_9AGAM|nr:hypothetical protein BV25DRAFT_1919999 [Artomyces pyxidatus]
MATNSPSSLSQFFLHCNSREEEMDCRSLAADKCYESVVAQRKPLARLPFKYRVTKGRPDTPLLAFGFPRTRQQLFEYARKHDLRNEDYPDEPVEPDVCMFPSLTRLRDEADEPYLSIMPIFSPTGLDLHLVTLYTNYTMHVLQCVPEEEEDIIRVLQNELGIDERPMWYWDYPAGW